MSEALYKMLFAVQNQIKYATFYQSSSFQCTQFAKYYVTLPLAEWQNSLECNVACYGKDNSGHKKRI